MTDHAMPSDVRMCAAIGYVTGMLEFRGVDAAWLVEKAAETHQVDQLELAKLMLVKLAAAQRARAALDAVDQADADLDRRPDRFLRPRVRDSDGATR